MRSLVFNSPARSYDNELETRKQAHAKQLEDIEQQFLELKRRKRDDMEEEARAAAVRELEQRKQAVLAEMEEQFKQFEKQERER